MYPITNEVKALFESENRKVLNILGTDVNGNYFRITDADVIQDSFQIDRYCCNGERLEIGTTIAAQLSMKLENSDGRFNNTIFEGAELRVEVGVADWTQASPTVYWIPCGYFICDYQPRKLNIITITALDRMIRFDAVVDRSRITLPTVPVTLIGEICGICGVGYIRQANLPNADAPIDELPDDAISYRNLIAWCAGLMGTNAFVDWTGTLYFSFYSNTANYVSTIDNRYNSDLYENDLSITGVTYTTDDGIEYVEGTGDYAFDLTGNVFISPIITAALPNLNNAVNGFTYRPFTASVINAPYLWPMDIITFRDKDGNDHQTALTNVCFGLNGTTALESRGMTYIINRQKIIGSFTKEQTQFINRMNNDIRSEMVTGVKGNEESLYRQGNVNLTPANIGAVDKAGDTMTGDLTVQNSGEVNIHAVCTNTNVDVALESTVSGRHGIWSYGYWDGSNYIHSEKWMIYRDTDGKVYFNDVLGINHGGTGATEARVLIGANGYSTILNGINAVRATRIFPISMRKTSDYCADAPSGYETSEANILLVGDDTRITATLYLFAKGSGRHIYVRDFYNGSWFDSQWTQIH